MRIAESLAKMKLHAVAGEDEVDEALRLFQVSTLDAALSGNLSGMLSCVLSAQKSKFMASYCNKFSAILGSQKHILQLVFAILVF